jgi:hypothetical protein
VTVVKSQKGQAIIESLIGFPMIFSMMAMTAMIWSTALIKLETSSLLKDLSACYSSTRTRGECTREFRQLLHNFPGHWRTARIIDHPKSLSADLRSLPLNKFLRETSGASIEHKPAHYKKTVVRIEVRK